MKTERLVIVLLIIIGLIGISILGSGITGMVTFDETVKKLCSSSEECDENEVCCLFYGEDSGVCQKEELCTSIREITRNEKKEKEEFLLLFSKGREKQKNIYSNEILFGSLIIIFVFFSIYFYALHSKSFSKKTAKS